MATVWTSMIILLSALTMSNAFSRGAPEVACLSLDPSGHGPSTATDLPPYKLTVDATSYSPGQAIKVTLSGTEGAQFKGFLLVANSLTSTTSVGHFDIEGTKMQKVCVASENDNGVTHTSASLKSSMTFTYYAPNPPVGDIVFRYTVVRGKAPSTQSSPADYFSNLKSQPLSASI